MESPTVDITWKAPDRDVVGLLPRHPRGGLSSRGTIESGLPGPGAPRRLALPGQKGRFPSGGGAHFRGHQDLDTARVLPMARDEKESAGGPRMGGAALTFTVPGWV